MPTAPSRARFAGSTCRTAAFATGSGSWSPRAAVRGSSTTCSADPTELDDLVDQKPEMADKLVGKWAVWAERVGVKNVERLAELR